MPLTPNPFQPTFTEIASLTGEELVRLLNLLIAEGGRRSKIPPDRIDTTIRINVPDGGADAITNTGRKRSRWLGRGLTAWQFKRRWPGPARLRKEMEEGHTVQDVFRRGGGYTLVVGQDLIPTDREKKEEQIRAIAAEAGCKGEVRLFAASHVAPWVSEVPAALLELRPALRNFSRADYVLRDARHSVNFEPDELREATIQSIGEALFGHDPVTTHARIQGQAGVGKTRLALEIVRRMELDQVTLYSEDVSSSRELFGWAERNDHVQAVVIVDECGETEALALAEWAGRCQGRLRLITVGAAPKGVVGLPSRSQGYTYDLNPLEPQAMERVVRAVSSTLSPEHVRWIASRTRGFVKLAVVVAEAIAERRATIQEMVGVPEIRDVVRRILLPSPDGQRALSGVALLTRVGWQGEVAAEGRAIAEFIGLDWNLVQTELRPAILQGILVVKGRYWYVSPELLAIWLAAGIWAAQPDRIIELLESLPSQSSKDALLERLSQLGDIPEVRSVLEDFLGERGPFRDIDSVDNGRTSRLFSVLARGAPGAAMQALSRIFAPVSHARLLAFEAGRRDIVWALEDLAQQRDSFFEAARLLRRLAEAENEHWANNATGVWNSLFLTFVAQTEVPAFERLTLVEEALTSESIASRRLGLSALSSALQAHEFGMALRDSEGMPRGHWRPRTWGEVWEIKRRALALLGTALDDPSPEIRREAKEVFLSHARSLVLQRLADEVVGWFTHLSADDEAERRKIWESIEDVLRYASDALTDEQSERLQAGSKRFYGDSLADRIKRFTGPWSHVDWPQEGEPEEARPDRVAERLADEAIGAMDEVLPILPWLASGEAEELWPFIRRLGELDTKRQWLEPLLTTARKGQDPRIVSGYLVGRAQAGDSAWGEDLLDEWSGDRSLAMIVFDATARGTPSDRAAARLLKLVDDGWVEARYLTWLRGWPRGLSPHSVVGLVKRLLKQDDPAPTEGALMLLSNWLDDVGTSLEGELEDIAWQTLEHPSGWSGRAMLSFYWRRVAGHLLSRYPIRMARCILRMYTEGEPAFHDERLQLLEETLRLDPVGVWDEIGDALLGDSKGYRLMWALEESGLLSRVPEDALVSWVKARGAEGAEVLAHSLKPEGDRLPEIIRFLLREYGESVGGILAANFRSGSWWGSEVAYLQGKIAQAKAWAEGDEPAVMQWATSLVRSLQSGLASARVRDEEDDLL